MEERLIVLKVTEEHAGKRADVFVSDSIEELTRNAAQHLLDAGRILINGAVIKKKYAVSAGEVINVFLPEVKDIGLKAQKIDIDVIYEDEHIIVVNKQKGMVVHPAAGHEDGTLVNALMYHCGENLSGINGELRPGIVHRIDKDTSGLLVCAKNDAAHRSLAAQIEEHSAFRIYSAVVKGKFKQDSGRIEANIGRHPTDRKKMAVTDKNSRFAATEWEVIEQYNGYAYIRCKLETGRTHQIRVHMAYIGHPVLGDMVYGAKKPELGMDTQCLHAGTLELTHPQTGERMKFEAPLPDYFQQVLTKLRMKG